MEQQRNPAKIQNMGAKAGRTTSLQFALTWLKMVIDDVPSICMMSRQEDPNTRRMSPIEDPNT